MIRKESAPAPKSAALSTPDPRAALPRRLATDEQAGADVVSPAVAAERERCVRVCEAYVRRHEERMGSVEAMWTRMTADHIAQRIMSGE